MSEGESKNNLAQFPEGDDWFAWRLPSGEVRQWYKGRYAIVRTGENSGPYEVVYLNPKMGPLEDAVLEFDDQNKIEVRQINSARDYGELQSKCDELNRTAGFAR